MKDPYLRQRIENWVSDFCSSDVGQGLSPAIREYAFDIGVQFLVAACDARGIEPAEIEESDVRAALLGPIARLKLPAAAREYVPGLCGALLCNLGEHGRISGGIMLAAYARALGEGYLDKASDKVRPITRPGSKLNRNDPCPCGSGKKYKKCCMRDD